MRRFDELARFWNDTRSQLPQSAWSWPLLAAAAGTMVIVIGMAAPERPTEAGASAATAGVELPVGCEDQTWPYFDRACLRGGQAKRVRVLEYEPALAAAAIGATQWAPRGKPPSSRHKQATHDPDRTVRSDRRGRNAAQERSYAVPGDAFSAYGSARRR